MVFSFRIVYGSLLRRVGCRSLDSPALVRAQNEIQKTLDNLNGALEAAARDLAEEESFTSPRDRSILSKLCAETYVVDCCAIDSTGRIVAIEPEIFRLHEGADIAHQDRSFSFIEPNNR